MNGAINGPSSMFEYTLCSGFDTILATIHPPSRLLDYRPHFLLFTFCSPSARPIQAALPAGREATRLIHEEHTRVVPVRQVRGAVSGGNLRETSKAFGASVRLLN